MHLLFIDDSEYKNYGVFSGIIINIDEYFSVIDEIKKCKEQWGLSICDPVKFSPPNKDERYKPQRSIHQPNGNNELKKDTLKIVAENNTIVIISMIRNSNTSIDGIQKSFPSNYDKLYGIENIYQRFQMFLQEVDDRGMVVIEKFAGTKESDMKFYFENFHQQVLDGSQKSNCVWRYDRICDFLSYSHDWCSYGLQLADLVASSFTWTLKDLAKKKSLNSVYLDIYKSNFRFSPDGKVGGYGVICYPGNSLTELNHICNYIESKK